jgi:multicomponent K+:H+ antiporter subunit G
MMQMLAEIVVSFFIVCGGFFMFVGSFGLAKLTDTMRRLHAPTKATTLGIGSMLIASMLYFFFFYNLPTAHELLITLFLFLTAPVIAYMIAKAHLFRHKDVQATMTEPTSGGGWATFAESDTDARMQAQAERDSR